MERIRITSLLKNNGCITVNKYLIQAIGLNEAVLYCELCSRYEYFEDKGKLVDGYFYNTQYDLQAGTGLGEKAQRTAISKLKKLGLIDVKKKGIPAKRYFTIIDNDENLLRLLSEGKEKLKRLENPKDTSIGGNLKSQGKELDNAKRSANNTNNNIKNNTNLHHLDELTDVYVLSYLSIMSQYGYKHKRVSNENMSYIEECTSILQDYDVDLETWTEEVYEHFGKLPVGNDGDILTFLAAGKRYFEIDFEFETGYKRY